MNTADTRPRQSNGGRPVSVDFQTLSSVYVYRMKKVAFNSSPPKYCLVMRGFSLHDIKVQLQTSDILCHQLQIVLANVWIMVYFKYSFCHPRHI